MSNNESSTTGTPLFDPSDLLQTLRAPLSRWPRWYLWTWVGAACILLCSIVWIRWQIGGEYATLVFSNLVVSGTALIVPLTLFSVVRQSSTSTLWGWRLLAIGTGFEAIGELTWMAYELGTGDVPFPGLPDLFYLTGYPVLALGLVLLTTDRRRLGSMYRLTLDGLIVGGALLTVSWYFLLEPILTSSSLNSPDTLVAMAYPILDIVVGSIAFVVALNTRGQRRTPILLISLGLFIWVIADSTFAYLEFTSGYVFSEIDSAWVAGNALIALGALHPAATLTPRVTERRRYEFIELLAPYGPFAVAMVLIGYLGLTGQFRSDDVFFGAFVLVALLLRQSYVFHDAAKLSRELDEQEATLNKRNKELVLLNQIVRHDICNDMMVALAWGRELRNHVSQEANTMLDRVIRTTQHTVELTETLRDFLNSIETEDESELTPTDLQRTLHDTIDRRREAYPDAEFSGWDSIPAVEVWATPLLSCVFRNLLNNAIQHNSKGKSRIEISAELSDETVIIRIADNGPGIPVDQRDVVFGRGEKGLKSAGSGVGLYLVDTLMTQFGGDVWIEANEPTGAVFVITLSRVTHHE